MRLPQLDRHGRYPAGGTVKRGALGWLPVALLAVAAVVRALRFAAPFLKPYEWDEAATGISGIQVLAGNVSGLLSRQRIPGYAGSVPSRRVVRAGRVVASRPGRARLRRRARRSLDWLARDPALPPAGCRDRRPRGPRRAAAPVGVAELQRRAGLSDVAPSRPGPSCSRTHSVFYRGVQPRRTLLGLGIVAGLGWWNSPLFGVYLAPFVWLALRHGLVWRREVVWFAGGAFLGSLPTALYEAVYFPSTRFIAHAGGSASLDPVLVRAATVFGTHVPDLLGVPESGSLQSSHARRVRMRCSSSASRRILLGPWRAPLAAGARRRSRRGPRHPVDRPGDQPDRGRWRPPGRGGKSLPSPSVLGSSRLHGYRARVALAPPPLGRRPGGHPADRPSRLAQLDPWTRRHAAGQLAVEADHAGSRASRDLA